MKKEITICGGCQRNDYKHPIKWITVNTGFQFLRGDNHTKIIKEKEWCTLTCFVNNMRIVFQELE